MKISLIIAFYKNTKALELIVKALEKQTFKDFETIIAEDDNNAETLAFINQLKQNTSIKIKHVYQEKDEGFRKNKIMNEAIKAAESDYIVFIDGDCIPSKSFLESYIKFKKDNEVLFGRRVMIGEKLTQKLYVSKNLRLLSFFSLLLSDSTRIRFAIYFPLLNNYRTTGIWGCNWGLEKKHLLAVNGFDEDYITAGVGEDIDIEYRLVKIGLKLKSIRFAATQFHLHHPLNYNNKDTEIGYALLKNKLAENYFYCKNGIQKVSE